ncbi:hypothetical protein BRARA_F02401, partial [Brassica rapa]
ATPTWGDPILKRKIWKCNTPPKINHFLWRLLSKSLSTGSNLKRRHIIQDDQCKRCCSAPETEIHLFFECPYAQRIWRASGISNTTLHNVQATLEEKIEVCLMCNTSIRWPQFQDLPISILWRIWKSRNTLIFQQRNIQWWRALEQAKTDAQEWSKARSAVPPQQNNNRGLSDTIRASRWRRPRQGWSKCNFDASFNPTTSQSGHAKGSLVTSPLEAEYNALIVAMQQCWIRGYAKVIFEGDNKKMIDNLQSRKLQFGLYNWVREARWWSRQFQEVEFKWINRDDNGVADKLSKIDTLELFEFYYYIPRSISPLLHNDYVNSFE